MTRFRIRIKPIPTTFGSVEYRIKGEALVGTPRTYLVIPYVRYLPGGEVLEEDIMAIELPRKPKNRKELEEILNMLRKVEESSFVKFDFSKANVVTTWEKDINIPARLYKIAVEKVGNEVKYYIYPASTTTYTYHLPTTFRVHLLNPEAVVVLLSRLLMGLGNVTAEYKNGEVIIHGVGSPNYVGLFRELNKKGEVFEEKFEKGLLKIPPVVLSDKSKLNALLMLERIGIPVREAIRKHVLSVES